MSVSARAAAPARDRTWPAAGPDAAMLARRRAAVRLAGLAGVLVVGILQWLALLAAPPRGRGVLLVLAAVAAAALLPRLTGRPARRRLPAAVATAAALLAGALLAAGVPAALLDPREWGALASGLAGGIRVLPGVIVPYDGPDGWVRAVIAAGGCALVVIAALTVAWPRRTGAGAGAGVRWALPALGVLFAVPAIQRAGDHPWLTGALFAVPLCALVLADRLPARSAGAAATLVAVAVAIAVVIGPRLDRGAPVVDVQRIAGNLQRGHVDRFNWNHGYGPLDWPRTGREMMIVRASHAAYWKAEDLEQFDGTGWRSSSGAGAPSLDEGARHLHPGWRQRVRVSIAGLETRQFLAPGETLSISHATAPPVLTRPGGFSVAGEHEPMASGASYEAEAFQPRPSAAQLRDAPADYPDALSGDLTMLLPSRTADEQAEVRFAPFGSGLPPVADGPGLYWPGSSVAARLLGDTGYGRTYRLARRLAAASASPYDLVQRIESYLSTPRFRYQEDVPRRRLPLPAFLFVDRAGYCQQFSGAMALLLRMGGVPARVSAGFTPGRYDAARHEYVVSDFDAHSWVEAWFAGIGWVTFDPTPSQAPARSDTPVAGGPGGSAIAPAPTPANHGDPAPARRSEPSPRASGPGAGGRGGGASWAAPAIAAAVAALVLAAGAASLVARRRRRAGIPPIDAELAELVRALRRTRRSPPADTTLAGLEQRFAGEPAAREYLRAVAARRFAGDAAARPSAAQRRALRRALADGLGLAGRLRALWALPPRLLQ